MKILIIFDNDTKKQSIFFVCLAIITLKTLVERLKVISSGIFWTIIQNCMSIIYGIVAVPILLNYFGKEQYGIIGIAISVNVYMQLLDMGMNNANIRFMSNYLAKGQMIRLQNLFSLVNFLYIIIGLINSIALLVVSFFIEDIFNLSIQHAMILRKLLMILSLNAVFSWFSVTFDQFIRANELVDWINKRLVILKLLQFFVLMSTIIFGMSINFYFFCYIFMSTLIIPISIFKTKSLQPNLKFIPRFNIIEFKRILPYSVNIFTFYIFQFSVFNFRPLILGAMNGPSSVAEFNIMNSLAIVVTVISSSMINVLLPTMTKMKTLNDQKGINDVISYGTKYLVIILTGLVFIIIANIKEIFTLYVGSSYTQLSMWMIIWLLSLLLGHRNVMVSLVFTENNLKSVTYISFIAMIIAFILYFIFIPKFGVGGVIIGMSIHELIHTLFYYIYFIPNKTKINTKQLFIKKVLPIWSSFSFGFICVYFLFSSISFDSILASLFIKSTTLAILFLLISYILMTSPERNKAILAIRKIYYR